MAFGLEIIGRSGNAKAFHHIESIERLTQRGIRQAFFKLGASLRQELRSEMLKKNKRGRVYTRRDRAGRRRRHQASAPGQTPANRTGTYRKNVGFQIQGSNQLEFGVREDAPYALFLERGTRNMAPRPGVGNAVKAEIRNAHSFFEASIDSALR